MKSILISTPYYFGYIWAINQFCKKLFNISKMNEIIFILVCLIGQLSMDVIHERYAIPQIFYALTHHAFYMGLVILLFQADIGKKILASSILITLTALLGNFFGSFFCCIELFFLHTVKKVPEPFLNDRDSYLILYASFFILILAVCVISRRLVSVFNGKPGRWYVVLAIPLLAITAIIDIANWGSSNGILVTSNGRMGLYYDQLFSHTEICTITALSMFASGFYVFGMDKIYSEQRKSSQYHAQITAYKMLADQYRQSERLRHDIKNHMIALSGLMENREFEKMKVYLGKMEATGGLSCNEETTGNKVVDAILHQKRQQAENSNILWECDVRIPKECRINEFDLCVLFGNLLDNAVEACERLLTQDDRFISIQAKTVKKCFLLEVKNSTDTTYRRENGLSAKENLPEHGIGLLNTNDVVRNYNGATDISVKDGIFTISILIPLQNHPIENRSWHPIDF